MNIKLRSRIRNKISHLLLKWRRAIENARGGDYYQTGEKSFIQAFAASYKGKTPVIFDVGANVGTWSAMVESEVVKQGGQPVVYAFEPVAEYKGNAFALEKVVISETSGTVTMRKWKNSDQSSLYERRTTLSKQGQPELVTVPAIRLDTYIEKHGITHIDLLKVDVEGHELSVLKILGNYLRPDFISYIQFEYGPTYVDAGTYLLDVYQLLKDYRICKMFPNHLEVSPYQSNFEDFTFTNYIALK